LRAIEERAWVFSRCARITQASAHHGDKAFELPLAGYIANLAPQNLAGDAPLQ
jgi:hypothetical protein